MICLQEIGAVVATLAAEVAMAAETMEAAAAMVEVIFKL